MVLIIAVLTTQIAATLILVYGLFMSLIGWIWALVVWVYALVWFFINDIIKIITLKVINRK